MSNNFDVIIVGAGLVGLTLACLLVKQGLRTALVEVGQIQPLELRQEEYQLRVSAINSACKEMFTDLNVWQKITLANRLSAFEKMFVWDSMGRGKIQFDSTQIAEPCLGYILENATIHNALLEELRNHRDLTIFARTQPTAIAVTDKAIELRIKSLEGNHLNSSESMIRAELLVGADGSTSWVRQYTKIESYSWPYHHQAFVTTVETELAHQKTAWQCFLPDGPLALLPLFKNNVCSIVWSAPPASINRLSQLEEGAFNLEITRAFEHRLGNIRKISRQAIFPLYMRHAKQYITNRIALVGDAAHTIHPLAGQGVNMGFADACSLARKINHAKTTYNNCGDYLSLRQYERDRKSDNWVMIFGMEFIKRLFQHESYPVVAMRSLGLDMVNRVDFIKSQFIYQALGQ